MIKIGMIIRILVRYTCVDEYNVIGLVILVEISFQSLEIINVRAPV